jgi:hypothetical protein
MVNQPDMILDKVFLVFQQALSIQLPLPIVFIASSIFLALHHRNFFSTTDDG